MLGLALCELLNIRNLTSVKSATASSLNLKVNSLRDGTLSCMSSPNPDIAT